MTKPFRTSYSDRAGTGEAVRASCQEERQVVSLIQSKLALGLNFVALVEQTYLGESRDAEQLLRHAEQAVIEVKQLLPVLTGAQHRSVGPKLNELREALDRQGHCEKAEIPHSLMS